MNFIFFYILGGIVLITIIILWTKYLFSVYKEKDEPTDGTILENYMPQYSEGHTELIIDKKIERGDRIGILAYPRDIDYIKMFKGKEKLEIKPYRLYFLKSHFESLSKNAFSEHRNKAKAYPPNPEDLPEGIKNSQIGKVIMNRIKNLSNKDHEVSIVRAEAETLKSLDRLDYSAERQTEYMEKIQEAHQTHIKTLSKEESRQIVKEEE